VRRYSDFSWLNAYLLKTYAFRLIPPLPPKRLSVSGRHLSDSGFLGRRAKGLARFSSALLSHHVFKADPVVLAFYSRPELDRQRCLDAGRDEECWRSLAPAEEAAVPHELEDRLLVLKTAVVELAAVFTRHCQGLERAAKRSEAEAQDCQRLAESSLQAKQHIVAAFPASSHVLDRQLVSCSRVLEVHSTAAEESATWQSEVILQRYKAHRELYSSFRDLLARHQVQAPDAVDKLRGKVASAGKKLEAVRTESKAGWEVEASKLEDSIKADEQRIAMLLRRRLFIRVWFILCSIATQRASRLRPVARGRVLGSSHPVTQRRPSPVRHPRSTLRKCSAGQLVVAERTTHVVRCPGSDHV
jgi:sorting nexin-8